MSRTLCLSCFRIKGDYEVCRHCGYREGASPKAEFQLKPGTILKDRYIIGGVLGYGGFGITYKAYDTVLSIIVAVKEFFPSGLVNRAAGEIKVGVFGSREQEYRKFEERFLEEARNMALFAEEKDIVNVFAYFQENGTAYIIMEYIEGTLLKTRLREQGRMQESEALEYIDALLKAVQKIHRKGIVHKDISPDNIFLTGRGSIKLFDFGAARFQSSDLDPNFSNVVKQGYAPPEQYRSNGYQDERVDIYAVGAVLYQMLTGERPVEALERLREDTLLAPREKGCKMKPKVDKAVMKALAMEPDARFSSAEEFRQALIEAGKKKSWKWWQEAERSR